MKAIPAAALAGLLALFAAGYWMTRRPADPRPEPQPEAKLGVLVALDAADRLIGAVVRPFSAMDEALVALDVHGETVVVLMRRDSFAHPLGGVVYFPEAGCKGTPLIGGDLHDESLGPPAAVAGPGRTLYLGDEATLELRPLASLLRGENCEPFDVEAYASEATAVRRLDQDFLPPYRIEER